MCRLTKPVVKWLANCPISTGWPNKYRTFFRYHIFAATTDNYNHAVFAEVLRDYSRKQQATVFLTSVKYSLQTSQNVVPCKYQC